jgi:DNA polymerase-1
VSTKTTVLVDADTYVYQAALAVQTSFGFDDAGPMLHADEGEGTDKLNHLLEGLSDAVSPYCPGGFTLLLALSDSGTNFRKDFWPTYKGNRGHRPLLYDHLRRVLMDHHGAYVRPRLEADDILGILATSPKLYPGPKLMVSIDKDLMQVPGRLFNPAKEEYTETNPEQGFLLFMAQVLTGDACDNYPGCPGIGPVKAGRILDRAMTQAELWDSVVKTYELKGKTAEDALVQARCARILLSQDYDFKNRSPILWTPTLTSLSPR